MNISHFFYWNPPYRPHGWAPSIVGDWAWTLGVAAPSPSQTRFLPFPSLAGPGHTAPCMWLYRVYLEDFRDMRVQGQLSLVIESPPIVAPEGTLHLLLIWAKCRSVPDSRCCCPWLGILGHRAQRQTPVTGSQSLHSLDPPCFPTLSSSIPQLVLPSP